MMSEYLDRPARTEEEASADILKAQAKILLASTNRVIKLVERMQAQAK